MTHDFNDRLNSCVSEEVILNWCSIPKHPGWYTILATCCGIVQCSQEVTHVLLRTQNIIWTGEVGWITLSKWRVWLVKARIKNRVQHVGLVTITISHSAIDRVTGLGLLACSCSQIWQFSGMSLGPLGLACGNNQQSIATVQFQASLNWPKLPDLLALLNSLVSLFHGVNNRFI